MGTNNAPYISAEEMVVKIIQLKNHVVETLNDVHVIISLPILRVENRRANNTLIRYAANVYELNINLLDNGNITEEHLGKKGLHLSKRGAGRLALNIMYLIRQL